MINLKANEICPYAMMCPYNNIGDVCYGARPNRNNQFNCDHVVNGQIKEGLPARLSEDKTGRMKIIME